GSVPLAPGDRPPAGVPTGGVPTGPAPPEVPDPGGRHAAPDQSRASEATVVVPPVERGTPIPRSEPTVVSPLSVEDADDDRPPPPARP
ncbi:MAG: hypothetical protein AB7V44_31005, partial [Pseudonocardia sp.]